MSIVTPSCPFCGFDEPQVTVYADAHVQAFISTSPINRYHVIVTPRMHYERLPDIPYAILCSVMKQAQHLSRAIASVAKPDAISLLSDDDLTGSGFNLVAHWKLHLIPRYKNDAVAIDWNREADPGPVVRAGYCNEIRGSLAVG